MLYVTIVKRKFFVWIIIPVLYVFTVMLLPTPVDNGKCAKPDTTSDESDYHVISSHLYFKYRLAGCVLFDVLFSLTDRESSRAF